MVLFLKNKIQLQSGRRNESNIPSNVKSCKPRALEVGQRQMLLGFRWLADAALALSTLGVDVSKGQFVLCVAHALLGVGFWPSCSRDRAVFGWPSTAQ